MSTRCCTKAGVSKTALRSSSGQLSFTPLATCTNVSRPTTSQVRNVALFGRPIAGPVSLSTASMLSPMSFTVWNSAWMANTPTRFAMNAGVSLQSTVVLPRRSRP